jgi:hypothetical protein
MTNSIGPTKIKSELEVYKGTPVRITTAHGSALGIVDKISSEYLSLRPSWVNHGLYSSDNKLIDDYKFQDKLPKKIKLAGIVEVEPLEEGYIEKLVKNVNENSHPSRIILPSI